MFEKVVCGGRRR